MSDTIKQWKQNTAPKNVYIVDGIFILESKNISLKLTSYRRRYDLEILKEHHKKKKNIY